MNEEKQKEKMSSRRPISPVTVAALNKSTSSNSGTENGNKRLSMSSQPVNEVNSPNQSTTSTVSRTITTEITNSRNSTENVTLINGTVDSLFEPSVEMMINDFDDERTLEEEEALAATEAEDPSAELSNLQRESNMPIEELLALYNCRGPRRKHPKKNHQQQQQQQQKQHNNHHYHHHNHHHHNSTGYNEQPNKNEQKQDQQQQQRLLADAIDEEDFGEQECEQTPLQQQKPEISGDFDINRVIALDDDDEVQKQPVRQSSRSSSRSSNNEMEGSEEQNGGLDKDDEEEPSELRRLYPETFATGTDQRHLRTISRQQSEDEDEDADYSPDEDDFKKTIMVGSEFQAVIPEELCKYGDALPYENEDKLVWDPSKLREADVVQYEQKSNVGNASTGTAMVGGQTGCTPVSVSSIPIGNHLRDDEQNLYLLLQCGHNIEEALRRRRIGTVCSLVPDTMSQWSEEECRNFENGLRIYGKDFHTIQQLKVKTRSVGELVQFYYLWKKTERHDVFANKARLEKKKYSLHPGLTDYMDRFLEEQECNGSTSGGTIGPILSSGNLMSSSGNMMGASSGFCTGISGSGGNHSSGGGGGNGGGSGCGNSNMVTNLRERSSSPSVNCLMYSNYRRQRAGIGSNNSTAGGQSMADSQSITDPLGAANNEIDLFLSNSTNNLKPKESHHYSINTTKL